MKLTNERSLNNKSFVNLQYLGVANLAQYNTSVAELVECALREGEGNLANNGALVVKTGKRTGRSPNDRFIVDTPTIHDSVAWGSVNKPMDPTIFEALWEKALGYISSGYEAYPPLYVTDGFAGANRTFA